ncbi:MAG: ATP-binding protein [Candidatus Nanohaloarchaea archaeon]
MTSDEDEKTTAAPYLDVENPFEVGADGAKAEYLLKNPEELEELAVGARTLIRDSKGEEKTWISAQVKKLEKYAPFLPKRSKKLYLEEEEQDPTTIFSETNGPHSHQPMIINLDLEEELTKKDEGGYERSAVQRPPAIDSEMVFPDLKNDEDEPSLQNLLSIKDQGIPLGAVGFESKPIVRGDSHEDLLIYRWDLNNLDIKHTFVVGESGSGKTVLLKRMGLHIRKQQEAPVVLTDVQGDLVQLALSEEIEENEQEGWQEQVEMPTREEALEAMRPFKLVVPQSNNEYPDRLKALKKYIEEKDSDKAKFREIGLRLKDVDDFREIEYLFRTNSQYAAPILNDAVEDLENHGEDVKVSKLLSYLDRKQSAESDEDRNWVMINRTKYGENSLDAVIRGTTEPLKKYFDNDTASLDQDENPFSELREDESTVILYLEHLDKKQRIMYEMQMINWLYEKRDKNWNPYVFIDEAHQVIPKKAPFKGSGDTFERLKLTFERLAREGRKYNINLILSTQSPQDIAQVVNDQCQTRIVMKSNEKNARAAELNEGELRRIADSFGKGQFFIKSPFNDTSEWLRLHSWLPNLPHAKMEFWDDFTNKVIENN